MVLSVACKLFSDGNQIVVGGRVFDSGRTECVLPFGALVALAAVEAVEWRKAGKSLLQRQARSPFQDVFFFNWANGREWLRGCPWLVQGPSRNRGRKLPWHRRRDCRPGRPGPALDAVHPAPQSRLEGQQSVAAGQIHGIVRALGIGRPRPSRLQCVPYKSSNGRSNTTNSSSFGEPKPAEFPQGRQFARLPMQPATNVKRPDHVTLPKQMGQQDATIQPAAGEHADR